MQALLDVNVLIALFDPDHLWHSIAVDWLNKNHTLGWATCPLTENGFLRIISHGKYSNPVSVSVAAEVLRTATHTQDHKFWADDISLLDTAIIDSSKLSSSGQITDAYLLALAINHEGRFVTFDRRLAPQSVFGATADNLLLLS